VNRVERLLHAYGKFVELPWDQHLAGAQRVWFAVHDKTDERRIRARLTEFELATRRSDHEWLHVDLTNAFGEWLAHQEYRESYFESPEDLDLLYPEFEAHVVKRVRQVMTSEGATGTSLVAVSGIACLFGFIRASALVKAIEGDIRGRLLVFFPGEYQDNNYRLLDARDGWNYMAVPILAADGAD